MVANDKPTDLQVVWDEIEHLKNIITDQASQIQRLRKFARLDELEAVTGKLANENTLIRTVTALTASISVLAETRQSELHPDVAGQQLHEQMAERRSRQVRKNLSHLRYLSTLTQERTEVCPCGRHTGIRFITKEGTVEVDNYCPLWWWIAMSRMAFDSGKSAAFRDKMPLDIWLKKYALESVKRCA